MLSKLRAFLKEYCLLSPGDRVTVALSGGADSVALLFSLYLLKEELNITLEAAHFNHHLRGEESDRDEAFCRDFCGRYDIPIQVSGARVSPGKKGLEAAAREARYAFLRGLPGKVATAHTADDNAETVLLRLLRGTGLKGLGAIAPVSGNVIRPMLSVTRRDVEDFLEEYHLPHVEDSSNGENAFLRNRIRHRVMPLLYGENPRIGENLSALALTLRQDEAFLQSLLPEKMPSVSQLQTMAAPLRRRLLERFLKENGVKEPEQIHILQLETLVFHWNPSASMRFPGGVTVAREYDSLVRQEQGRSLSTHRLSCPGRTEIPELGAAVVCSFAQDLSETADGFLVQPRGALCLRARQAGDSITLPGGTRTLKKLYIDRRIPASQRPLIPVLADEEGVLAVFGLGAHVGRRALTLPAVRVRLIQNNQEETNGGSEYGK